MANSADIEDRKEKLFRAGDERQIRDSTHANARIR